MHSLFEIPFKRLFAVQSAKILEIWNPWVKVMARSGPRFEHFCLEMVSNRRKKIADFPLQSMAETTLPDGLETSGQRAYR